MDPSLRNVRPVWCKAATYSSSRRSDTELCTSSNSNPNMILGKIIAYDYYRTCSKSEKGEMLDHWLYLLDRTKRWLCFITLLHLTTKLRYRTSVVTRGAILGRPPLLSLESLERECVEETRRRKNTARSILQGLSLPAVPSIHHSECGSWHVVLLTVVAGIQQYYSRTFFVYCIGRPLEIT